MESWVNFGGKEGHTNVQHSAGPGFELGTLWLEGRDLTTAPTTRPKPNLAQPQLARDPDGLYCRQRDRFEGASCKNHQEKGYEAEAIDLLFLERWINERPNAQIN